MDCF
jgi:hypothetical protein